MGKKKSNDRKSRETLYKVIDVPFDRRMECFYCGCIHSDYDHMPPLSRYHDYIGLYDLYQPLKVPSCNECNVILGNSLQPDIYQRFDEAKVKLTKRIGKYIRMGELWDEDDIQYGEFTGNLFKSLAAIESMAKTSRERLSYKHWPVSIDGDIIERAEEWMDIVVDNKKFTSMNHVIEHINRIHKIPVKYFDAVLAIVGMKNIDYAFRFCKTVPVKSEAHMKTVLIELQDDYKIGEKK